MDITARRRDVDGTSVLQLAAWLPIAPLCDYFACHTYRMRRRTVSEYIYILFILFILLFTPSGVPEAKLTAASFTIQMSVFTGSNASVHGLRTVVLRRFRGLARRSLRSPRSPRCPPLPQINRPFLHSGTNGIKYMTKLQ
jgi:hypothetical protein